MSTKHQVTLTQEREDTLISIHGDTSSPSDSMQIDEDPKVEGYSQ